MKVESMHQETDSRSIIEQAMPSHCHASAMDTLDKGLDVEHRRPSSQ